MYDSVGDDDRTSLRHATNSMLALVTDLSGNIRMPARGTKWMIACQGERRRLGIVEADRADEGNGLGWLGGTLGGTLRRRYGGFVTRFGRVGGGFAGGTTEAQSRVCGG
jgi:hypothetical protein